MFAAKTIAHEKSKFLGETLNFRAQIQIKQFSYILTALAIKLSCNCE